MTVFSLSTGKLVAARCTVAQTQDELERGLLGRDSLAPGEGLWLIPADCIHSVGMRFAFDGVFLDAEGRVLLSLTIEPGLFGVCGPAGTASVLELPAGSGLSPGNVLLFR